MSKDSQELDYLLGLLNSHRLPQKYKDFEVSKDTFITADIASSIHDFAIKNKSVIDPDTFDKLMVGLPLCNSVDGDDHLFEQIWYLMNHIAPVGCYFGSHQGNGSLIGFFEEYDDYACPLDF